MNTSFLRSIAFRPELVADSTKYPYSIPAIRALGTLKFNPKVTFFMGENGSGKSTLLEAVALALGFNSEGGSRNFRFATRRSESDLWRCLRVVKGVGRPRTGYFYRGESFFNVATEIERLDEGGGGPPLIDSYGGMSLHERSHGEAVIALVKNRFGEQGLYLMDEPEAALSPSRQLELLRLIRERVRQGCQFVIATHSPILLAYPGALLYELFEHGIRPRRYEETEHVQLTRAFLNDPEGFLDTFFGGEKASR